MPDGTLDQAIDRWVTDDATSQASFGLGVLELEFMAGVKIPNYSDGSIVHIPTIQRDAPVQGNISKGTSGSGH